MKRQSRTFFTLCTIALGLLARGHFASAQTTAFTYQGKLDDGGHPANGLYDLMFTLYDSASSTTPVSGTVTNSPTTVNNGLFTAYLDFGSAPFNGSPRWLQVYVRTNGSTVMPVALTPRTFLASTPYATYAQKAASVADGAITTTQLAPASVGSGQLVNSSVTKEKIAPNSVVTSVNGLRDDVTLSAGANVTLTPSGNTIQISSTVGASSGWSLAGNAGATDAFLGTTDNRDLVFKVNNLETLRLTASQDLILQRPADYPRFSVRNGLGVYGQPSGLGWGDDITRPFANLNVGGPVLYGEVGGGLGVKYQTSGGPIQETLALKWDRSSLEIFPQAYLAGNATFFKSAYFGSQTRQMLNLWGAEYGIGVQSATLYQRTSGTFAWHKYGTHSDAWSDPGPGGSTLMTLDDNFLMVRGGGGEKAYLGGDGLGNDVQFGSLNPSVQTVVMYNAAYNGLMDVLGRNVSACTLTIRGGCDLAEPFQMSEEKIPEGSVVVIDETSPGRLKQATSAYDTRVAGIVSGANGINPGIALHQEGVIEGGQNVALTGRVYVKADANFGPIKPGDLLTTSDTLGHAMKVTEPSKAQGAIIGKAMSSLEQGQGMVLVLVTLQ